MTTTLQQLIDESIFISTEHQARLAELSQGVEWDVDFSVPSFTLQSDPPVSLTPHLLGTDSEARGSWIWAWQELGHFPPEVVAGSVQARETGARNDVAELITDELPAEDGLARRVTLAAKTLTGLWAHYPARVGAQVTAWLLLEGPELELPPLTVETMMRVIAEALQTGTAQDHHRAVDSYIRLRGAHIEWDTDATCVITTRDGAQRLWFEDRRIDATESADPLVDDQELLELEERARSRMEALRADRADALRIAAEQTERDRATRTAQEQARREATAARSAEADAEAEVEVEAREEQPAEVTGPPLPAELSREELEAPVPGASEDFAAESQPAHEVAGGISHEERDQRTEREPAVTYGGAAADGDLPYDQDPRDDAQPGEVTTSTVPVAEEAPLEIEEAPAGDIAAEAREEAREESERLVVTAHAEDAVGRPVTAATPEAEPVERLEPVGAEQDRIDARTAEPDVDTDVEADTDAVRDDEEQPRKKGFLSRFFGR